MKNTESIHPSESISRSTIDNPANVAEGDIKKNLSVTLATFQRNGVTVLDTLNQASWGGRLSAEANINIGANGEKRVINKKGGLVGIQKLQRLLNKNGESLVLDGIFGSKTSRAAFDYINGLKRRELRLKEKENAVREQSSLEIIETELELAYRQESAEKEKRIGDEISYVKEKEYRKTIDSRDKSSSARNSLEFVEGLNTFYSIDTKRYRDIEYHNLREVYYRYYTSKELREKYPQSRDFAAHFLRERIRLYAQNTVVNAQKVLVESSKKNGSDSRATLRLGKVKEQIGKMKNEDKIITSDDLLEFQRLSYDLAKTIT